MNRFFVWMRDTGAWALLLALASMEAILLAATVDWLGSAGWMLIVVGWVGMAVAGIYIWFYAPPAKRGGAAHRRDT